MKIVDLSHEINSGMPFFPGTEKPELEQVTSLVKDGFVEHRATMLTHTGTHIDVPAHLVVGGLALDQMSVDNFIGKAAIIDLTGIKKRAIGKETLRPFEGLISKIEFLILKTGWEKYWGEQGYFKGFPALDPGAAQWLGEFNLKGVGVDAISIDPAGSKDYPIHHILFKNNMIVIENLANLDELGGGVFTFSCLPLKFENGDGSPVRAVGIL